uniref:porin family protein n=1 Tax=uncultured Draconibacterium sp. TaxID=1573823 RepID=UPI003216704B
MLQKTKKQPGQLFKQNSARSLHIKKLLALLVFVGIASYGNAQFNYGFKVIAGAGCQSDMLEIANNCDMRFSTGFGIVSKYQFSEGLALKSGLEYLQKGRKLERDETSLSNKLQYLNLPVKAEFSAGEKAGFKNGQRIFFAVGPYASYLLDAEGELDNVSFDLKNDTKDFDFGISFEIGIELPVFKDNALQLGLNYDMGFVEVYKSEPDLHNKMASIGVGLLF